MNESANPANTTGPSQGANRVSPPGNLSVAIDGTYIRADRLMWGIWGIAKIRAKTDTAHWILQIPAQFNSYLPALQFTGPLKCLR